MVGKLQERIRQTKPFATPEAELYLYLVMVTQRLTDAVAAILKTKDLSPPQYNALRILRGAGEEGLMCGEVAARLVHRVPDVTRLLDRLEARGWITRKREECDRRVVRVWISPEGKKWIAPLDKRLLELHADNMSGLTKAQMTVLIELMEHIQAGME